jgi:hypothetical protein
LIEFTNGLQTPLNFAIVIERLTDRRNLFGTQADLAVLAAGITDSQDPEEMTLAARALGTT